VLLKNLTRNDDMTLAVLQERSGGLLGPCTSAAMRSIESAMVDVADTDIPVMVMGETGTGKEILGLAIHRLSSRRRGRFIRIRCSSLSLADLNELLLTSADASAHPLEGTLFLDEIADMDRACQTGLLQAFSGLSDGLEVFQPGVRVVSTTSRNLDQAMESGQFRRDLFYRLSGICLRLPPLRERREDVMPLANFFLDKYSSLFARPRPRLSGTMSRILSEYSWPGNIRELENTMKRVVALGDERLAWNDLIEAPRETVTVGSEKECPSLKETARAASRQAERELILKTLMQTRWNRKRAAQELQISYKALLYKLKRISKEEHIP
jgi:two-component system, NtrC family, response regulator AtoC